MGKKHGRPQYPPSLLSTWPPSRTPCPSAPPTCRAVEVATNDCGGTLPSPLLLLQAQAVHMLHQRAHLHGGESGLAERRQTNSSSS